MSATPAFGTQLIGQTEKALGAILDRLLADTNLTERQWVTLTIAVMSGGSIERDQYLERVAGVIKLSDADAQTLIDQLSQMRLLDAGAVVSVTDEGKQLHARIRGAVTEITARLWGDLPADDLAVAGRVLATVLERTNAELARL